MIPDPNKCLDGTKQFAFHVSTCDLPVRIPFMARLCLLYNKLFRFRIRRDWLMRERLEAEVRRQADAHGEDLRYAEMEYKKTVQFLQRFGQVDLKGKRVLDFGCRFGGSTLWYSLNGASYVVGVDQYAKALEIASEFLQKKLSKQVTGEQVTLTQPRIEFRCGEAETIPLEEHSVDLIVSEDVVEHLEDPEAIIREWWRVLAPGGRVLLSFGPLWYHPHGVHLWEIFPGPWTHLLFPERTCVFVRNLLKADGNSGLRWTDMNKMTMRWFERLLRGSPFRQVLLRRHAILGLKPLAFIPALRELFISQVDCILAKD